jgi:cyanophycin synthetase
MAQADRPQIEARRLETPHHVAVAFSWSHRTFARLLARTAWEVVQGSTAELGDRLQRLRALGQATPTADDLPEMLRDIDRKLPVIAVTGTNGKTTTTRLIASILTGAGKRVGWTSSSGVLIEGEVVLEGDYTGPAGAARVFGEPGLDVAVLETARGGILLRGLGYESNDVSVVTNVSADHLGLHGVHSVEGLARVKMVVPAVTRPDGFAVLNAGDPLVLAMREQIVARPFLVARTADNQEVATHREGGGWALWVEGTQVRFAHDGEELVLTDLDRIPISFGGRAAHMLENALCGAAACLAIGLDPDKVSAGLAAFRNQPDQNRGRLNVYDVNGVHVVLDFAHNVAGLTHLLNLGRGFAGEKGQVIAVIGTAGDRPDDAFVDMGRLAGERADVVVAKDSQKYLRGRQPGEMLALLNEGLRQGGCRLAESAPGEYDAFDQAFVHARPGDAVVVMCVEEVDRLIDRLDHEGARVS